MSSETTTIPSKESHGSQNGVNEKPQTPIKTDLRSSMLYCEETLSDEDEVHEWVFHCPHCGMSIAEEDMDEDEMYGFSD